MPTNHTPNYSLSQWEHTDKVLMEDFNADNAKLDAALTGKAEASTLAALEQRVNGKADVPALEALAQTVAGHTTTLTKKGNCHIWSASYTGTGGSSAKISFPDRPLIAFVSDQRDGVCFPLVYGARQSWTYFGGAGRYCDLSWSVNSVSLSGPGTGGMSMNENGKTYLVIALIAMD